MPQTTSLQNLYAQFNLNFGMSVTIFKSPFRQVWRSYCWFSPDVMAAMLEYSKRKNFDYFFCLGHQHGRYVYCLLFLLGLWKPRIKISAFQSQVRDSITGCAEIWIFVLPLSPLKISQLSIFLRSVNEYQCLLGVNLMRIIIRSRGSQRVSSA